MDLAHDLAVAGLQLGILDIGGEAEQLVGARHIGDVVRADPAVLGRSDAQQPGDPAQVGLLELVEGAIGRSDEEQALQHVLAQLRGVTQDVADLARIGLEARHVLLGQVEQAAHVRLLGRRHLDNAPERCHLVLGDGAVRARRLGRERDEGNGERHVVGRIVRRAAQDAEAHEKRAEAVGPADGGDGFGEVAEGHGRSEARSGAAPRRHGTPVVVVARGARGDRLRVPPRISAGPRSLNRLVSCASISGGRCTYSCGCPQPDGRVASNAGTALAKASSQATSLGRPLRQAPAWRKSR